MTSDDLKTSLMHYYLCERNFLLAVTEQPCFTGIADMIVMDKNHLTIEIEIKVSKSDLMSELNMIWKIINRESLNWENYKELQQVGSKGNKHEYYISCSNRSNEKTNNIPNRFYFCVPEFLAETAKEYLQGSPYGLLVYHSFKKIKTLKSGKVLHRNKINSDFIVSSICKMGKENVRLRSSLRSFAEERVAI